MRKRGPKAKFNSAQLWFPLLKLIDPTFITFLTFGRTSLVCMYSVKMSERILLFKILDGTWNIKPWRWCFSANQNTAQFDVWNVIKASAILSLNTNMCSFRNRKWWQCPWCNVSFSTKAKQFKLELVAMTGFYFPKVRLHQPYLNTVKEWGQELHFKSWNNGLKRCPSNWTMTPLHTHTFFSTVCLPVLCHVMSSLLHIAVSSPLWGSTRSTRGGSNWNYSWNIHHCKLHLW